MRYAQSGQIYPVAPCAGAWIEIAKVEIHPETGKVAPCAGAWIEIAAVERELAVLDVAPCAGAWIEIRMSGRRPARTAGSLPARERGLKLTITAAINEFERVAPCAGAWIEISTYC